jgi:hypothetical protein
MFFTPEHVFGSREGVGSRFQDLRSRTRLGGTEGFGSRFHVLRSQTRFRWFRGRQVPFSYLASPYSFSTVPRASAPIYMFCAPVLVFGGAEGIGSRFHVLRARTHFRRYRRRRVSFSCFTLPYTYSAVRRVSGPVVIFCASRVIFGGS